MGAEKVYTTASDGIAAQVPLVRKRVELYFRVYDVRWNDQHIQFHVTPDVSGVEQPFEALRQDLKLRGFIPLITQERGETLIYITSAPGGKRTGIHVNMILLALTIFTTVWAGAILWSDYQGMELTAMDYLRILTDGGALARGALFFSLPLLTILGVHESAHYFASKRHGLDASLPFLIPVPPPMTLGTFGAFISMREPMPSKKSLLDVGAAGPIAGFLVAIPVAIIGLYMMSVDPVIVEPRGGIFTAINPPLLYYFLSGLFTIPENASLHPTAFAGWVGLLITAFNLLPAGQLDGGHISRALFGENSRYISYVTVGALFVMGFLFQGWFIFALIVLFMGARHPPPLNDITPLDGRRIMIGVICVAILFLSVHPQPLVAFEMEDRTFEIDVDVEDQAVTVAPGSSVTYSVTVANGGHYNEDLELSFETSTGNMTSNDTGREELWEVTITMDDQEISQNGELIFFELEDGRKVKLDVDVRAGEEVGFGEFLRLELNISRTQDDSEVRWSTKELFTTASTVSLSTSDPLKVIVVDELPNIARVRINVKNQGTQNDTIQLEILEIPEFWAATLNTTLIDLVPQQAAWTVLTVDPALNATDEEVALLIVRAHSTINEGAYEDLPVEIRLEQTDRFSSSDD